MNRLKLALAGAFAFCASALPAAAQTTLTMWTFLDPARPGGREQALKTIIEGYERLNPDIRIKVEPQVWTTLGEKFVLGHNAGNAPDIGWVNMESMGLVMQANAAADLAPLVTSRWPADRRRDIVIPAGLDAMTTAGKLHALPIMYAGWVLMYRKDLLQQAGLTVADLKTWEGVTGAARKMTRTAVAGQPDVWGMGLGLSQDRASATPAFLGTIGAGPIFDDKCNAKIAGPGAERAVRMQAAWILDDKVTPREALALTSDDAIDQFSAGRFAMQIIANSRFEQIQRTAAGWDRNQLGIAPIPSWSADKPGPALVAGWFAVAWAKSPRVAAAARFIDYMTGPDAMALWNIPGGQVPMLHSVAARPEMSRPELQHLRETAAIWSTGGTFMPAACNWTRTLSDFNLATQQVVLGQRSLADAVKGIERATQDRQ
jgi:multiple sugar transport system substrate-binding protein